MDPVGQKGFSAVGDVDPEAVDMEDSTELDTGTRDLGWRYSSPSSCPSLLSIVVPRLLNKSFSS